MPSNTNPNGRSDPGTWGSCNWLRSNFEGKGAWRCPVCMDRVGCLRICTRAPGCPHPLPLCPLAGAVPTVTCAPLPPSSLPLCVITNPHRRRVNTQKPVAALPRPSCSSLLLPLAALRALESAPPAQLSPLSIHTRFHVKALNSPSPWISSTSSSPRRSAAPALARCEHLQA